MSRLPITRISTLSIILACIAGNRWLTPVFIAMDGRTNPASIVLVVAAHALIIMTTRSDKRARFGLTFAFGSALMTVLAMPLNVFGALIGDNFKGLNFVSLCFVLFVGLQVLLAFASVRALRALRSPAASIFDDRAWLAVASWALSFMVAGALLV